MGQVHMTSFFTPLQIHLDNLTDAQYVLVGLAFCELRENKPTFEISLRLLTCFCNFFYYFPKD